jgi:hypothetical protein
MQDRHSEEAAQVIARLAGRWLSALDKREPTVTPAYGCTGRIDVTALVMPAGRRVNCTLSPTFAFFNNPGDAALNGIVIAGQRIAAQHRQTERGGNNKLSTTTAR